MLGGIVVLFDLSRAVILFCMVSTVYRTSAPRRELRNWNECRREC
jgi:hypothetical protein